MVASVIVYPQPLYSRLDTAFITAGKQELIESTGIVNNSLKGSGSCDKLGFLVFKPAVEKLVELCPEIRG